MVSADDRRHPVAAAHYTELRERGDALVTSDYVLDETLTRRRYDFGHHVAQAFADHIEQAQKGRMLDVLWVGRGTWQQARGLFRKYDDQEFSFTDCTSFALTQSQRVDAVFAFDHHFLMFGHNVEPVV